MYKLAGNLTRGLIGSGHINRMEANRCNGILAPTIIGVIFILSSVAGCSAPGPTPPVAPASTNDVPSPTSGSAATSVVTVEPASPTGNVLLIYDDDGSRDGTAALLYLLGHPELSVEAITISYGEAHPEVYIQHIGRVLDHLGIQDIPFGAGQDEPLANGVPFPGWMRQMSDNFWNYPLPNAGSTYPFQDAPELMVSIINQASQPVTLFMSGSFTNLAQALRLDQGIGENIAAVYFMGGAAYVPGNITNLLPDSSNEVAEWNIYADPQAAKEVFGAGLNMYMIPLDATNRVTHNQDEVLPWLQGDERANLIAGLYEIMFNEYGFEAVEIFDLTAAVIMAQPELCAFQSLHLEVSTDNGDTFGQTVVVPDSEPNILVCLEPDVTNIKQALNENLSP